jgi:hypothetical protein
MFNRGHGQISNQTASLIGPLGIAGSNGLGEVRAAKEAPDPLQAK